MYFKQVIITLIGVHITNA